MVKKYDDFFPYREYKPLQINVMDFVSDIIDKEAIGLVEAYCGFGKTIATFAPALAKGKKVLLLTPNYEARAAATAEALRINDAKGKKILIADLRGKGVMCGKFPEKDFSHEACKQATKYAKDCEYYNNTYMKAGKELSPNARALIKSVQKDTKSKPAKYFSKGLIEKEPKFFREFEKLCDDRTFCSYEIMKKMIEDANIVILDYFWCFTGIYAILKKLINPNDFVLLVDEADMLIERIYNDFQMQLSLTALQRLLNQANEMLKKEVLEESDVIFLEEFIYHSSNFLKKNQPKQPLKPGAIINYYVLEFRAQARNEGLKGIITFETIVNNLMEIVDAIKGSDEFEHAGARPDLFLLQLNRIRDSPQYLTFIDERRNKIAIKPFEINEITLANGKTPSDTLNDFHSAILFSATIGDPKLFRRELGLKKAELFKTESMPHEKLLVLIDTELDTTFKNRPKNAPKYLDKIETIRGIDPSLLISCCNQIEADKILEGIPDLERAELESNLHAEQSYVLNIRTKHARSTNKAKNMRNCIIVGLPLPDYSDFYFQQRKKYLEKKYGKMQAGKMINRKAIDTAVQLMGRITRNLEHPKTITLADRRYKHDFFLGDFYFESIPEYIKPYLKTVNGNQMLKKELDGFWKASGLPKK